MTDTIYAADSKLEARESWARTARWSGIAIVVWAIVTHVIARVPVPPVIVIGVVFGAFVPFLDARRRGTYEVICTVPGHESMTATITIGT